MLKAVRPCTQPIGGVLPGPGRSRSLMRAAEQLAICDLQARIAALDHAYCVQLAESEALLLVEVDATICARRASSVTTTPDAIELLHAPLDALAGRVHSLLVKQGSDQAETFKRSLAGLASDLTAVHGQELRRMRESLHHAKCVAESEHERIRHAMKTQELQMKDDLRRDCDTRIAEAQAKQRKAEAATAAAVERPQESQSPLQVHFKVQSAPPQGAALSSHVPVTSSGSLGSGGSTPGRGSSAGTTPISG